MFEPLKLSVNNKSQKEICEKIIECNPQNDKDLLNLMSFLKKEYKSLSKSILLHCYRKYSNDNNPQILSLLQKRRVRNQSGVTVVTILTSPYPHVSDIENVKKDFTCDYDCAYCPKEPGMPRSYLRKEPAVLRAERMGFDPVRQIHDRLQSYYVNGHVLDKLEVLVLGGTWHSYPKEYLDWFVNCIWYAANIFYQKREMLSLEEEQKINESADCRIIGLTIETRPDVISKPGLIQLRKYGVTRVQIGIQHTNDKILKNINRQCPIRIAKRGIRYLKEAGFKVIAHWMPDLPGSSPSIDSQMFFEIISDPELQVDEWKIYPTSVVPWTKIEEMYLRKEYLPYGDETNTIQIAGTSMKVSPLVPMLANVQRFVPKWIRICRLIRDIPGGKDGYIIGGNSVTNLRQVIDKYMDLQGWKCYCIRCREVRNRKKEEMYLHCLNYEASGGIEYFISYENQDATVLYGFLRLRLSKNSGLGYITELTHTAIIRELHVYGIVSKVGNKSEKCIQHSGLGKKLLQEAEKLALQNGYKRIAVISGVGVRNYYRKQGYTSGKYYLIKNLETNWKQNQINWKNILFVFFCIFVFFYWFI